MTTSGFENFRKEILSAAERLGRDIAVQSPDFELHFLIFRRGQRQVESERLLSTFENHPAYSAAAEILRNKSFVADTSTFLGIASGVQKSLFGFKTQFSFLGFAAVNIDSYVTPEECLFDVYHMGAQALDTYALINRKNINLSEPDIILQPKRNQMALCRNNLKSDIFSGLMMYKNDVLAPVRLLAQSRGRRALLAQTYYRPEDYPFVIASDVMDFSIENLFPQHDQGLLSILKLAEKIALSFDKFNLKSWAGFSGPAQTMAWNGFSEEQILGTAIHTSSDPFIKATGNMLAEITGIIPEAPRGPQNAPNPYADEKINKANHLKMTEETFENAIVHAVEAESHLPLIRLANNQNEALLKGRMLGWCADALQSAANTFDMTLKKGLPPAPASRIEFQRVVANSDWDTLSELNTHIVSQKRQGHPSGFYEIEEWGKTRFDMRSVIHSLETTLKDPEYAKRLNYVSEVSKTLIAPTVAAAAPSMTPDVTPVRGFSPGFTSGVRMMSDSLPEAPAINMASDNEKSRR